VIRRHAASGIAFGILWGAAARIWMRLISQSPEFSWEGTMSIIVMAGLAGLLLGLVTGVARAGRSRWWRLVGIPSLVLFAGPGIVFVPALFLGGWSLSGRGPRWLRAAVGAVGLAGTPALTWYLENSAETVIVPRTLPIVVGASLLGIVLALGSRGVFRRNGVPGGPVVDSAHLDRQAVPRAAHQLSRARLVGR